MEHVVIGEMGAGALFGTGSTKVNLTMTGSGEGGKPLQVLGAVHSWASGEPGSPSILQQTAGIRLVELMMT